MDPTSMYYTTTLLYLYSILRGEKEMLPANEAYSSPILPSTYIYYPMLWAKGIVYIGKNVRESSNKQPPYVLLLLLVQFACISFIPSLSLSLLKMSVIVFSILLLATRVIWEPPPVGPQNCAIFNFINFSLTQVKSRNDNKMEISKIYSVLLYSIFMHSLEITRKDFES